MDTVYFSETLASTYGTTRAKTQNNANIFSFLYTLLLAWDLIEPCSLYNTIIEMLVRACALLSNAQPVYVK
jgi:hypothetical protein